MAWHQPGDLAATRRLAGPARLHRSLGRACADRAPAHDSRAADPALAPVPAAWRMAGSGAALTLAAPRHDLLSLDRRARLPRRRWHRSISPALPLAGDAHCLGHGPAAARA